MRSATIVLALLAGLLFGAAPARAAAISEVTGFGSNPGALKMYRYQPDGLAAGRPVVVAMHGCTQDARGYGTATGWTRLADRWGFTVVLPEQQTTNNYNRCFNWFQAQDTTRGQGEAASIAQMVARAQADGAGTAYASGLSGGGAMTSVMLATYPELFAGGGIVAGLPYGCATTVVDAFSCMNPGKNLTPAQWAAKVPARSGPWPTVAVFHGTADYTVNAVNKQEIVDQWTALHGIAATPTSTDTVAGYPHAVYASGGRAVVETYTITGMGHGQPVDPATGCGTATAYVLDVKLCAAYRLGLSWGLGS
ncbi:extracellular catalytic domain type 1 short-chain-length polyhydroxyalkanoate depolymerase [Actinokineospora bangkokensis]|uniref:Esterase n=1 Tax=Actinokineospora bangkokensis TaxID=1193682 RepID=A0A1Q9LHB5_9PSEU|nr:PHB depolymerase family esterase [Actinokineospora bangkokensis]OLR91413.1 esterase [Actinokineospora bangkokensis]